MSLTKEELIERIADLADKLRQLSIQHSARALELENDREIAFTMGVSITYSVAASDVAMLLYKE